MQGWIAALASLRLTAIALASLLIAAAPAIVRGDAVAWHLALPLGVLELNLLAAILTNSTFRRQFALLAFHIALATLVALVAIGRLTYLTGYSEVVEGMPYTGLLEVRAGPWHRGRAENLHFENERVRITYHPGPLRDKTLNRVRYQASGGRVQTQDIGDHQPLVLDGYRIYATFNKGFSPILTWWPADGPPVRGSVNLPRYPGEQDAQWREWAVPGAGFSIFTGLQIDGPVLDPDRYSTLRPPEHQRLIVRHQDVRHELRLGQSLILPGGVLRYEELRMWMGYQISYDWTTPWVLASALMSVFFLGLHLWNRYATRSWLEQI